MRHRRIAHLVIGVLAAWALIAPAPAAACIAVFEFELRDTSLEGEIRGANLAEQERLPVLARRLREWLAQDRRTAVCDMAPVEAEAKAANLYACGCVQKLAQRVGGRIAIVGAVHKVSNLILSISVEAFDVASDRRLIQYNADIRSNSERSWLRGLNWLIEHRLTGALAAVEGVEL